jgi:VCBS repeat-containing protein
VELLIAGDDSVAVTIASTVTAAAADDDPVIADSDNTGAVTEASAGTTDTATDTLVVTDADGEAVTWSCTGCNDGGATQTLTDVYGSWELTEASGAWTYTLNNADSDTNALDGGDSVQETIVMVAADASGGNTASITVTITITGANDLPTSASTTTVGAEDTTLTFQTSDFTFTDVDGDDSAATAFQITVLESSGDLECFGMGGSSAWADCTANAVVTSAAHIRVSPEAGETPDDITFSYKVNDGTGYSSAAYVKTIDFAAVNDAPVNTMGNPGAVNEDVALAITGTSIADSDDTSMTSVKLTADRGTFTLATSSATYDVGTQGTAASTVTISGTVANINTAIATITWTSASHDNTDASITMVTTDDEGGSDSDSMSITVNAVNDLPTTSTPTTQTGTEDTVFTGYVTSDFPFTDVDGDSITSITITVVESSGTLEKSVNGADWTDVSANDVILAANIQHLRLTPATDSVASVTFTYTVQDGSGGTDSAVMTTSFAAVNDNPVNTLPTPSAVNEDTALAITGTSIADVDDTSMTSVKITANRGTFTLATSSATYAVGTQGTPASTVTIGGTVSNINVALATITWTSASNDNADAAITIVTTDDEGGSDTDSMSITVNAVNDLPTSTSFTVTTNEDTSHTFAASEFGFADVDSGDSLASATLQAASAGQLWVDADSSGSMDNGEAVVANGDTITASNLAKLKWLPATNANGATYGTFTYTLNDGTGNSASSYTATLAVNAVDDAPVCEAGSAQSVAEGATVTLDATGSSDVESDTITYVWSIASGTAQTLNSATSAGPTFTAADKTASYTTTLQLACTANGAAGTVDTVVISVTADNDAPTAEAGSAQTVAEAVEVTLAGSGSDPEGESMTYAWTQTSGTTQSLSSATAAAPTFTTANTLTGGDLVFSLVVTDATGLSSSADIVTITITADNDAPTAEAGSAQTVAEGATVQLTAAASSDPEGQTLAYTWTHTSGTAQTLTGATTATPTFTAVQALAQYTSTFQVSVTDGTTAATDTVVITVTADNDAPTAEAGSAQTVAEGASVQLTAAGSSDPEGTTLAYTWTHTSGTAQTLTGATTATPTFTAVQALAQYTSTFQVSVTDGTTAATDTVVITVTADNDAPTAEAGSAQTVAEGASVQLTAAASSDPEGTTLAYTWTHTSGTAQTLTGATTATPTFTAVQALAQYTSTFQVSVTDGTTAATDTVVITVTADNDAPTAEAGSAQTVAEGASVQLTAAGKF